MSKVLEIGNVSKHYYKEFQAIIPTLTVVDKYEVGYDVINIDIRDFRPDRQFDFILSISTFEHMDSDRGKNLDHRPGESRLVSVAADNIYYVADKLLAPGGRFVLTAPLGYTPEWDATFWSPDVDALPVQEVKRYLMARQSEGEWKQVDVEVGRSAMYGEPYPGVNVLTLIEITK